MKEIDIIKARIAEGNLTPLTSFAESELEKFPAVAKSMVNISNPNLFQMALELFMMGAKAKANAVDSLASDRSGTSYEEIEKSLMPRANTLIAPGDRLVGKSCFYESDDGPIKHAVFVRYLMPSEMPQIHMGERVQHADCVIACAVDASGMPLMFPAFSGYFEIDE